MFAIGRRKNKPRQLRRRGEGVWHPDELPLPVSAWRGREKREGSPEGGSKMRGLQVVSILLTGVVAVLATLYVVGPRPDEIGGGGADRDETVVQATPTPTPEVQLSYDGFLEAGQIVRIVNTESCLNVRTYPSVGAPVWSCLPDGSELRLVLGPLYSDTMWWWAASQEGWVAEPYLIPAEEASE